MRIRLADYVADFLVSHGVTDVFSVVGGGAMHLNDALGHNEGLKVTYNHHEQACTIAAEGYTRQTGKIAPVCVTGGPGGTNAITGVFGAYVDSIQCLLLPDRLKERQQYGQLTFRFVSLVIRKLILHQQYLL